MSLKIVVLAKQVPDTRNVGKDAMNAVCSLWLCHKRTAQHGNSHDDKHDAGNDFTADKHS